MRSRFGRCGVLFLVLGCAAACGGNPSGPSESGSAVATATFDGQTIQFSAANNASGGSRRPSNPAWPRGLLDIRLANCNRPPGVIMAIYDANPAPGRYDVPAFQLASQTEVVTASLQSPNEASWNAGAGHRGSSGSLTIASISSSRISGSYSFMLVQRMMSPPGGIIGPTPPAPTKQIEGTFDLSINDRTVCP